MTSHHLNGICRFNFRIELAKIPDQRQKTLRQRLDSINKLSHWNTTCSRKETLAGYSSGCIVVTTVDPEIPVSSPEWVRIFYEAWSTAQGLPKPSSSLVVHRYQSSRTCKLIDGCSLELATNSVTSFGICHKDISTQ